MAFPQEGVSSERGFFSSTHMHRHGALAPAVAPPTLSQPSGADGDVRLSKPCNDLCQPTELASADGGGAAAAEGGGV